MCWEKKGVVHVCVVIGMSGMTNQFGSGLCSLLLLPPSLPLRSSSGSETSLSSCLPPSQLPLCPFCVISSDLALSRSSGKCDRRAG